MNGFPNYGSYFNPFASPQYMNNNKMITTDVIK